MARQQSPDQSSETVSVEAVCERAGSLQMQGQLDQAEQLYRAILQADPTHIASLHNLAILCFQRGRYDDAVALTREVVRLRPDLPVAHNTLAVALRHLGCLQEAEVCCRQAVRLQPEYAEAHNTLGDVLMALRRWKEAEACYRDALRLQPEYQEAHNNLGTALAALGHPEEAELCCREALRLRPGNAVAHNNLATVLVALGRLEEAEACCREALRLQPDYGAALNNLGSVLLALHRPQEAEACCREALSLAPGNAETLHNLGFALSVQQKWSEAVACLGLAATLKPVDADMLIDWFHWSQASCDWSHFREAEASVRNGVCGQPVPRSAYSLLTVSSTPEEQFAFARRVAAKLAVPEPGLFPSPSSGPVGRKLRLAYLSHNFHSHPITSLIGGLIERHDRRRFEVIGYGFDEDDGSAMRRRREAAFDRFVDISGMTDRDAAQLVHDDAIDVLVDLYGWLPNGRAKILPFRPAPLQVNYWGYTATMGADFIDYIIVDRFVVPPEQQCFFSERLVYLPNCYVCNDKREIPERTPSRGECGLPEKGFVFCCFNRSWKLTPAFFDVWMRLLRALPESVLWLYEANPWLYEANPLLKANLVREAEARGVAPKRLVFAPELSPAEHLARHRLADLFLDTLPFNANTTATDALWAGLPLLTCAGDTFTGRVAGSLLRSVGLGELVTTSLEEYEALALRLAHDVELLAGLRARLAQNRHSYPLFDIERHARNLESAYWRMSELRRAGRPPTAFSVLSSGAIA